MSKPQMGLRAWQGIDTLRGVVARTCAGTSDVIMAYLAWVDCSRFRDVIWRRGARVLVLLLLLLLLLLRICSLLGGGTLSAPQSSPPPRPRKRPSSCPSTSTRSCPPSCTHPVGDSCDSRTTRYMLLPSVVCRCVARCCRWCGRGGPLRHELCVSVCGNEKSIVRVPRKLFTKMGFGYLLLATLASSPF